MTVTAPYVGLDHFLEEDAALFFGRDAERKRIIGNLRASRLTLLYAGSGVGKSSLLRAGVAARLRQLAPRGARQRGSARYVPVVFSAWQGDPKADLIAALEVAARPLAGDGGLELPRDTLEAALAAVVAEVDATPLIILDQFEERFATAADTGDDRFDDELARCINRSDLRANFLISIREDAYPLIGPRFKARITNVYGNYLHLDFLQERAARDAIVEPVRAFNERIAPDAQRFELEPALVDAVLEQVRRGRVTIGDDGAVEAGAAGPPRVETAYLQLVMKRLWDEEAAAGSPWLRLETLQRLGGADTIVHGHLDDVMAELPVDQRDAAAAAFRFLVTAGGRKIALSVPELREFADADAAPLEPAIEHLERARILRPVPAAEPGGATRHELYHDVLGPAIREWRRRHVGEQTERELAQERLRTQRLERRNRRLWAAVVTLAAAAVATALYLWNPDPVDKLELRTIDARFAVRGERDPDPRILMIAVDDPTLEQLAVDGEPRIPRASYAQMLARVRADDPAVIALDVLFPGQGDLGNDRALVAAIGATSDRLVLPFAEFETIPNDDGAPTIVPHVLGRSRVVAQTGADTGFAGIPDDRDGRDRRADYDVVASNYYTGVQQQSVRVPSFAGAAAEVAYGGGLRRRFGAERRAWGDQSDHTTWIDYRGPAGTVPRVSALDVLGGRVEAGAFTGKVVVIGVTARATEDIHRTPLDDRMPGAEIQANAIDTFLHGAPLRDAGRGADIVAIVVLAAGAVIAGLGGTRRRRLALTAGIAAAFVAVVMLAFLADWILAFVAPLAGLVVAALGVAGRELVRAARARSASTNEV